MIASGFAAARAELAGIPRDTLLINIDGGDNAAEVEAAFDDVAAQLAAFGWTGLNGLFESPSFTIDPVSGDWSLNGTAFAGTSFETLWELVGEAATSAIFTYFGSQAALVSQLVSAGVDEIDLQFAATVADAAAAEIYTSLQSFIAQLQMPDAADFALIETEALSDIQALIASIVNVIPELDGALSSLILGLSGTNASALVALDAAVQGTSEADQIFFNDLANVFNAGAGVDLLFGFGGNDRFEGGADDDVIFGGLGNADTAVYSGPQGRYTLQISADGEVSVTDREGTDGSDTVTGVELLDFGGSTFRLVDQLGIATLTEDAINTFVELYIAYFNRAPDSEGLNFWGTAFANGFSLSQIASQFLNQPETQLLYPSGTTNLQFVTEVYNNVLGRAPDADGRDFWLGELEAGRVTRDQFILEALKGAKADIDDSFSQETRDLQLQDRAYLAEKTALGKQYALTFGLNDRDEAEDIMELFIRDDANSVTETLAAIQQAYTDALAADSGELLIQLVGVVDDPFPVI